MPLAAAESYCLPTGYRQQGRNLTWDDNRDDAGYWSDQMVADSARYQLHVYRWAARIIKALGLRSVLDAGSGPGTKLGMLIAPLTLDLTGIDQPSGVAEARRRGAPGRYVECDLESCDIDLGRTFDLTICADVVEHLVDPDAMLAFIRRAAGERGLVLFSTPERLRLRGRDCMSADKPEHVREWSRDEFTRYLGSRGFHTVESRLYPQDETALEHHEEQELRWRLGLADRSTLACHAVLCSTGPIPHR